jgi:hypothetical protein
VIGLFDGSAVEEWPCFNDDDDVMKMLHSWVWAWIDSIKRKKKKAVRNLIEIQLKFRVRLGVGPFKQTHEYF